jgi:hypothetical protein
MDESVWSNGGMVQKGEIKILEENHVTLCVIDG